MRQLFLYCGAHLGESIPLVVELRNMQAGDRIICFEPHPGSYLDPPIADLLRERGIDWEWRKAAIWHESGNLLLKFTDEDITKRGNQAAAVEPCKTNPRRLKWPRERSCSVPAVTLEEVLRTIDSDWDITCKLDIEGAEYPVCRQLLASGAIHRIHRLCVEWHWNQIIDESAASTIRLQWALGDHTHFLFWAHQYAS